MDQWIDWTWCVGALFMVLAASAKIQAGSQPKGALVVIALGLAQVAAVLAGQEKLAYVASIAMIAVAGLLIGAERNGKKRQTPAKSYRKGRRR